MRAVVGTDGRARHPHGQADEASGRRLGTGQASARTTPSSPAIRERSRPGGRGKFPRNAGRCIRSPATSPPWRPACRMRSPRRSLIRDRQCVAFVGDGGFSMLMAEFATCGEIQAAGESFHHQEQHARTDQVGADGIPRKSRNMAASFTRSTSRFSPRPAADRDSRSRIPHDCGTHRRTGFEHARPGPCRSCRRSI